MSDTIHCKKLNKEATALDFNPYPGPIGEKIKDNISREAWDEWLGQQTMLINEYRLNLTNKESRQFLETEMEKYFFGEGSEKPAAFTPPTD